MKFRIDGKLLCLIGLILIASSIVTRSLHNVADVCFRSGLFLILLSLLSWGFVGWKKAIPHPGFKFRSLAIAAVLIFEAGLVILACFSTLWLIALDWNFVLIVLILSLSMLLNRKSIKNWRPFRLGLTWFLILFFIVFNLIPHSRLVLAERMPKESYVGFLLAKVDIAQMRGSYKTEFHKFERACNGANASVYKMDSFFMGSFVFTCSRENKIIRIQRLGYL